jgi:peptidoglycan/xylan/chitin deacetylase (PgdA/CDA1 family)
MQFYAAPRRPLATIRSNAPQRAWTSACDAWNFSLSPAGLSRCGAARHDAAMLNLPLHRPPRHPHAWIACLLASQLLALAAWWRYGWHVGLPFMVATHLAFWWGVLWPRSGLYSPVLVRLPTTQHRVWLTIDDGPSAETPAVLDLLDVHSAKATFFVVGERAQARPELVREIVRRGHTLGNHSATHPSAWFWALGPRRMEHEITRTQGILQDITGITPRWFRAVVGFANPFVSAPLKRHGLARVAWTARGFDAVIADPHRVLALIERQLRPGAIVLLHEGAAHGRNIETLDLVLQRLQALGYRSVLPEELEPAGDVPAAVGAPSAASS